MAPILGKPTQIVDQLKDRLMSKFTGDKNPIEYVKSMVTDKEGNMTLGGIAKLGAASAFVSGATIPAIAGMTALAYGGMTGKIMSNLASSDVATYLRGETPEQLEKARPPIGGQPPRAMLREPGLTEDEAEATRWMRNAYNSRGNMPRAMAWFADDFARRNGREPQLNWLKVGIASENKALVDVVSEFANRRHLNEAVSFIAYKGNVAEELTRRVVSAEVANAQRDRLDRVNPDSPRSGADAGWFAYLKEKVTTAFTKRQEVDAAMADVQQMTFIEKMTGGTYRQRISDDQVKATFHGDADDWKAEAPSMLTRVADRHDRLREVAEPLREAARP